MSCSENIALEVPESECIFQHMLVNCKITKFREVNFKILACILAMPKIVAKIHQADNLSWCAWCGNLGSLEHILLWCPKIKNLHTYLLTNSDLSDKMPEHSWIFGSSKSYLNPIIWITNFVVYKAYLCAYDGTKVDILQLMYEDTSRFAPLFPVLKHIKWTYIL